MREFCFILCFSVLTWGVIGCKRNGPTADAFGSFEAVEILVSSEATGRLLSFAVEEGQQLEAGVLVGQIDTTSIWLKKRQLMAQREAVGSKISHILAQISVLKVDIPD